MAPKTCSPLWMMMCFLTSSLIAVVAQGKVPPREGADPQQLQDPVTNALSQTSVIVSSIYGMLAEFVESQKSSLQVYGAGVAVACLAACTLYCAYLYFDPEPYLFNSGKLGALEAKSIYANKKKC